MEIPILERTAFISKQGPIGVSYRAGMGITKQIFSVQHFLLFQNNLKMLFYLYGHYSWATLTPLNYEHAAKDVADSLQKCPSEARSEWGFSKPLHNSAPVHYSDAIMNAMAS